MAKQAKKAISLFALVLLVFVIFGYSFGKDMALRDNARDRAEAAQ